MASWIGLLPADREERKLFFAGLRAEILAHLTPRVRANPLAWAGAALATGFVVGSLVPLELQVAAGVAGARVATQKALDKPGGLAERAIARWRDWFARTQGIAQPRNASL